MHVPASEGRKVSLFSTSDLLALLYILEGRSTSEDMLLSSTMMWVFIPYLALASLQKKRGPHHVSTSLPALGCN